MDDICVGNKKTSLGRWYTQKQPNDKNPTNENPTNEIPNNQDTYCRYCSVNCMNIDNLQEIKEFDKCKCDCVKKHTHDTIVDVTCPVCSMRNYGTMSCAVCGICNNCGNHTANTNQKYCCVCSNLKKACTHCALIIKSGNEYLDDMDVIAKIRMAKYGGVNNHNSSKMFGVCTQLNLEQSAYMNKFQDLKNKITDKAANEVIKVLTTEKRKQII